MSKEAEDYSSSLCDLTFNSKPHISMLTMLADDYRNAAPSIVTVIEDHIRKVQGEKLPTLYLIDSIVKNVGKDYITLFSNSIAKVFSSVFEKSDEKVRLQMFKLRHTWNEVFPPQKLYNLDVLVHKIDPKWPVPPLPPTSSIHVNPNFMKTFGTSADRPVALTNDGIMREKILKERKELLELEKRKVELQLLQTKNVLEKKQRKLEESYTNIGGDMPSKSSTSVEAPPGIKEAPASISLPVPHNERVTEKKSEDVISKTIPDSISDALISRDPRRRAREKTVQEASSVKTVETSVHSSNNVAVKRTRSIEDLNKERSRKKSMKRSKDVKKERRKRSDKESSHHRKHGEVSSKHGPLKVNEPITDDRSSIPPEPSSSTEIPAPTPSSLPAESISEVSNSFTSAPLKNSKPESISSSDIVSITKKSSILPAAEYKDSSTSHASTVKRKIEPDEVREDNKKCILSVQDEKGSDVTSSSSVFVPRVPSPVSISSGTSSTNSPIRLISNETTSSQQATDLIPPFSLNIKEAECNRSDSSLSIITANEESGKDTDLRLLLTPVKPVIAAEIHDENSSEVIKKTKMMSSLFGEEDVDLRKVVPPEIPALPSPPPPPFLGDTDIDQIANEKSWAQLKSTDGKIEEKFSPRNKPDRLGRPSLFMNYPPSESQGNETIQLGDRARANCNLMIKEAEEQLRNGNINFFQYNKMLSEVMSIDEERKLYEAKMGYSSYSPTQQDEPPVFMESNSNASCPSSTSEGSFEVVDDNQFRSALRHDVDISFKQNQPRPNYENVTPGTGGYFERFDRGPRAAWMDQRGPRLPPFRRPTLHHRNSVPNTANLPPHHNPQFPGFNNIPRRMPMRPYRPPLNNMIPGGEVTSRLWGPHPGPRTHVPLADRNLLAEAEKYVTDIISIGEFVRQIRFYGDVAVVLLTWEDPREVCFQPGSRHLIIDKQHKYLLKFGAPPTEIILDDIKSMVRLGRPTRELYIDDKYYSLGFGNPPVDVIICGRHRSIMLEGPPPIVRFGQIKRLDLVAGKVNLIVDAKRVTPMFLDGKPQKFEIENVPCVLKFADSLRTILINGAPVPIVFGGSPVPIIFQGREHFIRLSLLPSGIIPGRVNIMDMEVYDRPASLPPYTQIPPQIPPAPTYSAPPIMEAMQQVQQPLDLLASVMPTTTVTPSANMTYSLEAPPENTGAPAQTASDKNISLGELFRKLVNIGLVPTKPTDVPDTTNPTFISEVDLSHPETLKIRQPALIEKLYSGIQCSSCGIRFPPEGTKKYSRHLDWHFRQNRKERASTKTPLSRNWYYDISDLIQYQEVEDLDENMDPHDLIEDEDLRKDDEVFEEPPSVPVSGLKERKCCICGDEFEEFFDQEKDGWHIKNAVVVDDAVYHPVCFEEFKTRKEQVVEEEILLEKEEKDEISENQDNIEIIDLDETASQKSLENSLITPPLPSGDSHTTLNSNTSSTLNSNDTTAQITTTVDNAPVDLTIDDSCSDPEILNLGSVTNIEIQDPDVEKKEDLELPETEKAINSDSDDDILQIEVIERKIESYELLDDEEEGDQASKDDEKKDSTSSTENKIDNVIIGSDDESDFDYSAVTVKQEKDKFPDSVDSSLPSYTATIDGNIVHEKAAPLITPGKIKINISRGVKSTTEDTQSTNNSSSDPVILSQPPPPGEEIVCNIKPKLYGVELIDNPTVNKGTELSGLCSIM